MGTDRPGNMPDLAALRRYFWVPILTLALAVAAALLIGAVRSEPQEARFRANVIVNALPPLFGPAVLPGPFDYARLATSDSVLQQIAAISGVPREQLSARLVAAPRVNQPDIDFKVTGSNALPLARAWRDAFSAAVQQQTVDVERQLAQPYMLQLEQANERLRQRTDLAAANPQDAGALQQLSAAEENYETAAKLAQSYDVVASTMTAQAFIVVAPHTASAGAGSTAGRLGAAVAIGLLAGAGGALLLDYAARRRASSRPPERAPADLRREAERRTGSLTR